MSPRKLLAIASLAALPVVASACYVEPAYGRVYYHHGYRAYAPAPRVYVAPPPVVVRPVPRPYYWR